jgi:GNAT superfamily N-acetyltransferase
MHIHVANSDDLDVIVSLSKSVHELHCALAPGRFRSFERDAVKSEFAKVFADSNARVLIAWNDATPIGCCVVKIIERIPNAWTPGYRRLLVDQMAVEPNWQRKGVGTQLMNAVVEFAREEDIAEIILEYWSNNDGARQFYKALKFVPLTEKVLLRVAQSD